MTTQAEVKTESGPWDASSSVYDDLVPLLRREGTYSGVWFGDKLIEAAERIEKLEAVLRQIASTPDYAIISFVSASMRGNARSALAPASPVVADDAPKGVQ